MKDSHPLQNALAILALLGIGITIGSVVTIVVLNSPLKPKEVSVGPIHYEVPTSQPQTPVVKPDFPVATSAPQGLSLIVVSAIVALGVVIGWSYRKQLLKRVIAVQKVYSGTVAVFGSAEEAFPDIEKEAWHSRTIRYLGAHNTTFLRERSLPETLLYRVLADRKAKREELPKVQFLHLDPSSRFIAIRGKELGYPADGQQIRDGIISSLNDIKTIVTMLGVPEDTVEIRYYDFHLIFRLILLDKYAYVGFYSPGRIGRASPVLKISQNSELYPAFNRFFDVLWEYYSKPAEENCQASA